MLEEGKRSYRGFAQGIVILNEVRNLLFLWLMKEQIPRVARNDKGPRKSAVRSSDRLLAP